MLDFLFHVFNPMVNVNLSGCLKIHKWWVWMNGLDSWNVECWAPWSSSAGNIEISMFLATMDYFASINIHVKHHEKGRFFLKRESSFRWRKWKLGKGEVVCKAFFTILLFGIKRRKVKIAEGHKRTISFDSSLEKKKKKRNFAH